ncbi:tRNA-U16,U17-dihydrouridine synthase [Rubrimonas cliftonensis]|uniref:tRNA-dihydrouridine(20/20a) synthase n=2 Tax=Rubrimonas cliftonensis TaxID=89524 RepID=A0A1H4F423_9RHOB|nr:tRNA-U16,U17-dihydrouridine synthase [Rubrimonas cliftonensis]
MMDWTDRHCRRLHRLLSRRALLYTEMVTATAVARGDASRLLRHDAMEHPLALQLGGSNPGELAEAVRIAAPMGFCEINLNVGCPSDRVQSGAFGACLMREPALVADCVAAMIEASGGVEITVKCRIGVDEQDPRTTLPAFVDAVAAAGVRRFTVHARKAWLKGLSPKENRDIPPLDHPLVAQLKRARPDLTIVANGGLGDLAAVEDRLADGLDGAMVGRAAYHDPVAILGDADARIFGQFTAPVSPEAAARGMLDHIEATVSEGAPMTVVTRHMLGLFAGRPGARRWRRMLTEDARAPGAGPELVLAALRAVSPEARAA